MSIEPSSLASAAPSSNGPRWLPTVLAGITVLLFVMRVSGPSNLMDNDQERPASYVLDAVRHGHWFCQSDWMGDIMSKPPLFTWLAALATLPVGQGNLVSLYFPCLLAMLLTVGLLFHFGKNSLGWRVGLLAGLMYLAAPSGVKHIALARTDGLFAATIALTAFMGFRAWTGRGSWVWFWLGAALAMLTKGPLGPVLGAMGLLAMLWEKRRFRSHDQSAHASSSIPTRPAENKHEGRAGNAWASHAAGLALFAVLTFGWFALAFHEAGQAFIDKVIGRELVGHVVSDQHGTFGMGFLKAPLYWLSRFLPWSVLALVGVWRVFRHPSADPQERRFERFLACWILGGLLLFSLAKHQRGDLPLPLYAPAALLAGRELARWMARWSDAVFLKRSLGGVLIVWAIYTVYLHTVFARTDEVRESEAIAAVAAKLKALPNDGTLDAMLHVDSPYALQFHLNTMKRAVSFATAAAALAGEQPVWVALRDTEQWPTSWGETSNLRVVARWPDAGDPRVMILANPPPPAHSSDGPIRPAP